MNSKLTMEPFQLSSKDVRVKEIKKYLKEKNINIVGNQHLAFVQDGKVSVIILDEQNKQIIMYAAVFNEDNTIKDVSEKELDQDNGQEKITNLETGEVFVEPLDNGIQASSSCPPGYEWRYFCENAPSFNPVVFAGCMLILRNFNTCALRAVSSKEECTTDCYPTGPIA